MRTYLLESSNPAEFKPIAARASFFKKNGYRAVATLRTPPPRELLVKEFDENTFTLSEAVEWVNDNVLKELSREHLNMVPIPPHKLEKAKQRWYRAIARRERAERDLEKAKQLELDAMKNLYKYQGPAPLMVEGSTYHASYFMDKVYYVEQKQKE